MRERREEERARRCGSGGSEPPSGGETDKRESRAHVRIHGHAEGKNWRIGLVSWLYLEKRQQPPEGILSGGGGGGGGEDVREGEWEKREKRRENEDEKRGSNEKKLSFEPILGWAIILTIDHCEDGVLNHTGRWLQADHFRRMRSQCTSRMLDDGDVSKQQHHITFPFKPPGIIPAVPLDTKTLFLIPGWPSLQSSSIQSTNPSSVYSSLVRKASQVTLAATWECAQGSHLLRTYSVYPREMDWE